MQHVLISIIGCFVISTEISFVLINSQGENTLNGLCTDYAMQPLTFELILTLIISDDLDVTLGRIVPLDKE